MLVNVCICVLGSWVLKSTSAGVCKHQCSQYTTAVRERERHSDNHHLSACLVPAVTTYHLATCPTEICSITGCHPTGHHFTLPWPELRHFTHAWVSPTLTGAIPRCMVDSHRGWPGRMCKRGLWERHSGRRGRLNRTWQMMSTFPTSPASWRKWVCS